jgi:hypothetical protein
MVMKIMEEQESLIIKKRSYGIPLIGYLEDLENLVGFAGPKLYQKGN